MTSKSSYIHNLRHFFYSAGNGVCLEDQPDASLQLPDPTNLPGLTFDADTQCKSRYGSTAEVCPFGTDVSFIIKLNNV